MAEKKKITHKILVPTKDGGYVNFNDLSEEQKQNIRNQCFTRFADSYMGQLGYTRVHTEDEAVYGLLFFQNCFWGGIARPKEFEDSKNQDKGGKKVWLG